MTFKKILLLFLTISILTVSGNALERRKPLPLKELQNPKGPSYVPIPYPQTNEEVITDLKYFFKKELNPSKQSFHFGKRFNSRETIMRDFLDGKDVFVGEIIRVKNDLKERERDYTFLIRLRNGKNILLSNISLNANGLFLKMNFLELDNLKLYGVKEYMIFHPYSDKSPIIKQFEEVTGYKLNENEVNKMRLVDGLTLISDSVFPAWEIQLSDGRIFFKTFCKDAFYQVESKFNEDSNDSKSDCLNALNNVQYEKFKKTAKNEILILKEIWRKK